MSQTEADMPIRIRTREASVRGANRTYVREVRLGRKDECEVQVESGVVSRIHAKIVFEDGRWWLIDDDSTNGTYLDGEEIDRAPLSAEAEVQLGEDGPTFRLTIPEAKGAEAASDTAVEAGSDSARTTSSEAQEPSPRSGIRSGATDSAEGAASLEGSVTQYVQHYFQDDDRPEGEHTRLLRQAYQRVQQKERRRYVWVIAGALALCVVLGGYAIVQHLRNERIEEKARKVFANMKEQDVLIAKLKRRIEQSGDASLQKQLAALEKKQREQRELYDGFVKELGVYRELSQKEREIYQVARIFGESEFGIPAGFVRRVKETIETYWKSPQGRPRLVSAIQRAEEKGYTGFIVKTMWEHSLPPEFFYLALQESGFNVNAIGPRTRHGIAKGMWQFIPSTAREYGLRVGPRKDERVVDPQDERHDFKKSTRAAARYLRDIYSTKAQASGLLVIASYNWGEHRVTDKLEDLPKGIPDQALEGIPQDPDKRNYWRFLREYSDRMPEETKEYVLKVFSAAVIGRNPELFGFEFQNPLREHMDGAVPST
ncbi:MAG: transglycosylase SLT domain-containing protein, partial [Salinibacter sp.]|uniref:transglycosylase SLT domain-containing protein n=1 Tax=Salinibacter sp. TaxID=2065818 RepID=UPI0035D5227B